MKGGKGPLPRFIPGIPTPDYDSTPDRSPFSHRYLILYFSVNASREYEICIAQLSLHRPGPILVL